MNINRLVWLAVILAALVMGGCSSTGEKEAEGSQGAVVEGSGADNAGSGADTSAAGVGSGQNTSLLNDPNSLLATRKIYFDFNQSTIRPDFVAVLRAHAAFLVKDSLLNIIVEGHADERGSREYNIALGERRALAVKRFLEAEGVSSSQITTVGYGEESPDSTGYNEMAWAANRRAVIVY